MSKLLSVEEVSRLTEYMIHNVPGKDELRRACDYAAAIAEAGRMDAYEETDITTEQ